MRDLGFSQVRADGTEIVVDGRTGELDDIFVYENVLVLVEYRTIFPQMTNWLQDDETARVLLAFEVELARLAA